MSYPEETVDIHKCELDFSNGLVRCRSAECTQRLVVMRINRNRHVIDENLKAISDRIRTNERLLKENDRLIAALTRGLKVPLIDI